jgi:hypothetical protein
METPTETLLIVKSAVEALAGLALALFPSALIPVLLGLPLDVPVGAIIGRIAGVALLALGIACWLARSDTRSPATTGLIVALLLYDVTVVIILLYARLSVGLSGIGLWPAVVLHSGLGGSSLLCLRKVDEASTGVRR